MKPNEFADLFKNSESILFIAMSVLSRDKDSIIPELLYTIKQEEMLKFITVFGGKNIYIPDAGEFKTALDSAMAAYLYKIQKKKWHQIVKILDWSDEDLTKIRPKVKAWLGSMSKDEYGMLNMIKEKNKVL